MRRFPGTIEAVSPLHHGGDEHTGNVRLLRSIQCWDAGAGTTVRLPLVSGNAIRGVLRRLLMRDLAATVGYEIRSPRLHHALMSGGVLESTDETAGRLDVAFRRSLRDLAPPVALLGTAVGNDMLPGCLRVDHALPVCRERAAALPSALATDPRAERPVREFTDFAFTTRRDDLRAERAEDEQARQMMVQFEVFVPGTLFEHGFALVDPSPVEAACLGHAVALWAEAPTIGGKVASGHGVVALVHGGIPDPAPYRAHLAAHAAEIRDGLDGLAERLAGKTRQASLAGGADAGA